MSAAVPQAQPDTSAGAASPDAKLQRNADYLARCQPQVAVCPPTNGGITQTYAVATSLYFNLPTADNAMCTDLLITANLVVNYAVGTGAAYAATASFPWSFFDRVIITYNGTQAQLRPILLKYYWLARGYGMQGSWTNLVGTTIAALQAFTYSASIVAPGVAIPTGNNTFAWMFRVPLRALHELNPAGVLPIMGQGTKGQVTINCAPNIHAVSGDPILQSSYRTAGTGDAAVVQAGSTVKCEAIYMDGTTLWSPTPLMLDIIGEPTAQYYIDLPLSPLPAGVINRQAISTLLQHYMVLSLIVDGVQSNKFATFANIVELEFDKDSVGRNPFYVYGLGTNVSVNDFFERQRQYFGQDFDEGVIMWVCAWGFNQQVSDLREGVMVLNMTQGGWTDAHYGAQLTTTSNTNFPSRYDTYLISLNPEPLIKA